MTSHRITIVQSNDQDRGQRVCLRPSAGPHTDLRVRLRVAARLEPRGRQTMLGAEGPSGFLTWLCNELSHRLAVPPFL